MWNVSLLSCSPVPPQSWEDRIRKESWGLTFYKPLITYSCEATERPGRSILHLFKSLYHYRQKRSRTATVRQSSLQNNRIEWRLLQQSPLLDWLHHPGFWPMYPANLGFFKTLKLSWSYYVRSPELVKPHTKPKSLLRILQDLRSIHKKRISTRLRVDILSIT